jgi:EmrB/QacA subfamily drug resistance transporter
MAESDGPTDPDSPYAAMRSRKLRLLIPLIVAFAFLMEQLDSTIVTTAIPAMAKSLGVGPLQLSAAVTSYVLSLAVFIPVSSWAADRFGTRRVFALALLIFTVASALCGLAQSLPALVAMRVLQGFGGAMSTPVGRLILLRAFPREQLIRAMTYMTIPAIIGPTIGPILGGVLTTYVNWRWVFYVNVPIGAVGITLALRFVEDARVARPGRFDIRGFLLCGVGLGLMQFGIENLRDLMLPRGIVIALASAGIVLLVSYFPYARGRANAVLDLSLFSIRTFRISTLVGGVSRTGINAVPFMLPLLFQIGFGLSAVESGLLTFISSTSALAVRPVASTLLRLFGFRRLLTWNGVVCAVVIASFALVEARTPHWVDFLMVLVFGIVRSVQFMMTNTLTYADTPAAKLSKSTALGGIIQQLTVSFGVSIAAVLLGVIAGPGRRPDVADFHLAFLLVALITLLSAPGFLRLREDDAEHVSGHRRAESPAV